MGRLWILAATPLLACGSATAVNWKSFVPYRSDGKALSAFGGSSDRATAQRVIADVHHASIRIDRLFLRNVPVRAGSDVALAITIDGIHRNTAPLSFVVGVAKARGADAFLDFEKPLVVDPFLYGGREIGISFSVTEVPASALDTVRRTLDAVSRGGSLRIYRTRDAEALAVIFQKLFRESANPRAQWSTTITFSPDEKADGTGTELPLRVGTTVLVAEPPLDAPATLKARAVESWVRLLKSDRNRLVYSTSREDFTSLPYAVITVTRLARSPYMDTDFRKALDGLDKAITAGNIDIATKHLPSARERFAADPLMTTADKKIETALLDWREIAISRLAAKRNSDMDKELSLVKKEIDALCSAALASADVLRTAETRRLWDLASERIERARSLMKDLKEDPSTLDPLIRKCAPVRLRATADTASP